MRRAWLGIASLAAGLAVIAATQLLVPVGQPPLYDGVVVEEPYRYLSPGPGEAGDPSSYAGSQAVDGAASPAFSAATSETPPQAQLIAQAGAFTVPPGTTALRVAIAPVPPEPADEIAGNAYRIAVTDAAGAAVPVASGSFVTLILRAPPGLTGVTIVSLASGTWQALPSLRGGQPDAFVVNVDTLGEFATRGTVEAQGFDLGPWLRAVGALAALGSVVVVIALLLPIRRPRRPSKPPVRGAKARKGPGRRG